MSRFYGFVNLCLVLLLTTSMTMPQPTKAGHYQDYDYSIICPPENCCQQNECCPQMNGCQGYCPNYQGCYPNNCCQECCPNTCYQGCCPTSCCQECCPNTCYQGCCPNPCYQGCCQTPCYQGCCPTTCCQECCPATCCQTCCPTTCCQECCPTQYCPTTCCQTCCPTTCCQECCPTTCCQTCCPTTCCPVYCPPVCCAQPICCTPCPQPKKSCGIGPLMSLLLGAAAGAGTGYAAGNNKNRHCHQNCCPPTPSPSTCPCGQDIGEQLIFRITLAFDVNVFFENILQINPIDLPGSGLLQIESFVVTPQECLIAGKTDVINLKRGEFKVDGEIEFAIDSTFPSGNVLVYEDLIAVNDPCWGRYDFGLQLTFNNLPSLSLSLVSGEVKSTKTQIITNLPLTLPVAFGAAGLSSTQSHAEYFYRPDVGFPNRFTPPQ
jgi:hypothetical protein